MISDCDQTTVECHKIEIRPTPFSYLPPRSRISDSTSSLDGMTRSAPFLVVMMEAAAFANVSIRVSLCSLLSYCPKALMRRCTVRGACQTPLQPPWQSSARHTSGHTDLAYSAAIVQWFLTVPHPAGCRPSKTSSCSPDNLRHTFNSSSSGRSRSPSSR